MWGMFFSITYNGASQRTGQDTDWDRTANQSRPDYVPLAVSRKDIFLCLSVATDWSHPQSAGVCSMSRALQQRDYTECVCGQVCTNHRFGCSLWSNHKKHSAITMTTSSRHSSMICEHYRYWWQQHNVLNKQRYTVQYMFILSQSSTKAVSSYHSCLTNQHLDQSTVWQLHLFSGYRQTVPFLPLSRATCHLVECGFT